MKLMRHLNRSTVRQLIFDTVVIDLCQGMNTARTLALCLLFSLLGAAAFSQQPDPAKKYNCRNYAQDSIELEQLWEDSWSYDGARMFDTALIINRKMAELAGQMLTCRRDW